MNGPFSIGRKPQANSKSELPWETALALNWLWPDARRILPVRIRHRRRVWLSRELGAYERIHLEAVGTTPDFAHLYCIGEILIDYYRKVRPSRLTKQIDQEAFDRLWPLVRERLEDAL